MATAARHTDEALVRDMRAGRADAFERLYGSYHAAIYNLCARIVCDREEATDLTQDVFVKAYSQLPDDDGLKLRAWLYRVAANACFNHLRAKGGRGDNSDPGAEIEAVAASVDEFERSQTASQIEETLGQLNDRYRTALVLKDLHGLPTDEIASVMDISRGSADVLVHRARDSFKRVFARVAGEGAPAPASLGLVLTPLAVPAALHVAPPLPAGLLPSPPTVPLPHPDASTTVGPGGGGLLGKLAAALSTKAAITAAAATLIAGGGVAVHEVRTGGGGGASAAASSTPATSRAFSQPRESHHGGGDSSAEHYSHWAGHGWPTGDHRHRATDGHTGTASQDAWSAHDSVTSDHGTTSGASSTHDSGTGSGSGDSAHSSGGSWSGGDGDATHSGDGW